MQDIKYRDFNARIIGETSYPMIGVRLPELRNYCKELLKQEKAPVFKDKYYEEVLLHGMYIGALKCSFEEKVKMIDSFLPLIDNWGICDSFVSSLKDIKKHKDIYYKQVRKYLNSNKEYYQRFGLVVLLDYYMDEKYLSDLFEIIRKEKYNGYYSKMAGAWLLSYLFINYFDQTFDFISNNKIDEFVLKKGIQKTLDSHRVAKNEKERIKSF